MSMVIGIGTTNLMDRSPLAAVVLRAAPLKILIAPVQTAAVEVRRTKAVPCAVWLLLTIRSHARAGIHSLLTCHVVAAPWISVGVENAMRIIILSIRIEMASTDAINQPAVVDVCVAVRQHLPRANN